MTDSSPQNNERLWLISGLLFLAAAGGAVSLLLGYGSPSGRRVQQDALAELSPGKPQPAAAAHAPASTPVTVVPKADLPIRPTPAGRTPDSETFLNQRFPYQVIADVKRPSAEETEQQVRAAFPDYAKALDETAKNPLAAAQAPAAAPQPPQMPPTDAER